ncbi:MAG: mshA 5 [Bacteroidetes bacterium]|nr:mshA 5 [Bacteroidota bacterium]
MRICIDARATMEANDGIGRYATELLKEYARRDNQNEYIVLKNPQTKVSFAFDKRFREIVVRTDRFGLKEQVVLPRIIAPLSLDLFHSLHSAIPLAHRGVMVMTVHDIIPVMSPWSFGRSGVRNRIASTYMTALVRTCANRAAFVAVSSDSTRRDMIEHLGAKPERLRRVYLGINHEEFTPPPDADQMPARLGITGPFFLTVTNFKPHKNTAMLLRAFRLLRKRLPQVQLAVVGADARNLAKNLGSADALASEGICILGYQDDRTITGLMSTTTAFVHPSLYEGFGFPVVEAMAAGAPVITSSAASLPELGGDAVLYVDPNDPADIARAMERISADAGLREDLRRKGKAQAALFSWKDNADAMLQLYHDAVTGSGGRVG